MKKTQLYGLIIMTFCFLAGFLVLQAMTSFVPKEIIAAFNGNYEHAKRFVHLTGIRSMYLLYDTNTDTKSEARMHKEIDNEGPTVVIFQDNKNVFGGVTFVSWVSSNSFDGWIEDSKAYLFTLYPSMKIFPIKKGQEQFAFYGQEDYSTCFGKSTDGGFELGTSFTTSSPTGITVWARAHGPTFDLPKEGIIDGLADGDVHDLDRIAVFSFTGDR